MPILINDFSWRQTEGLVIIRVPLKNIPHTKVDIFTSEIYVKVCNIKSFKQRLNSCSVCQLSIVKGIQDLVYH